MISDSIVMDRAVGIGMSEPEQWRRFKRLREEASEDELLALVEHKDVVVRCYAFRALAERESPQVFPILVRHLGDTHVVRTLSGCIEWSEKAADYFLATVSPRHRDFAAGFVMDDDQYAKVDSILLFRPRLELVARASMLDDLEPRPEWYSRVRQLVEKERVDAALRALARYRRREDIPRIRDAIASTDQRLAGLAAVAAFPDASFYPTLVERFRTLRRERMEAPAEFRELCIALARYDRPEVAAMFRDALSDRSAAIAIKIALQLTPHDSYQDVEDLISLSEMEAYEVEWNVERERIGGPTRR
jgi:HEAT repeat protein